MKKDRSWHVCGAMDEHKKNKKIYLVSEHKEMNKINKPTKTS